MQGRELRVECGYLYIGDTIGEPYGYLPGIAAGLGR